MSFCVSLGDSAGQVSAELVHGDGVSFESSNGVNDFVQVVILKTVVELLVDVPQVSEIELALSVSVEQGEVSFSAFFGEWVTLNK